MPYLQGSYDTLLLSFENSDTRDFVYDIFCQQGPVHFQESPILSFVTKQWVNGNVSNIDFFVFSNQCGRSFNDLTQYPIFPLIIADYNSTTIDINDRCIYVHVSKPVGALNLERSITKNSKKMSSWALLFLFFLYFPFSFFLLFCSFLSVYVVFFPRDCTTLSNFFNVSGCSNSYCDCLFVLFFVLFVFVMCLLFL